MPAPPATSPFGRELRAWRSRRGLSQLDLARTITTICRFGNAADVTLDELRVELVFPADAASEAMLRAF